MQFDHFLQESGQLGSWIEEKTNVCLEQDFLEFTNLQG